MTRLAFLPVFLCLPLCVAETSSHALLKSPTINRTHIVFSYAGDLWSVAREGGSATRLTTGVGEETGPIFSPTLSTGHIQKIPRENSNDFNPIRR
jgi:tricorn protease-like protein